MGVEQLQEEVRAPARERPYRAPAAVVSGGPAFILALQRSAGNQAVVRHLARCGATPCEAPRSAGEEDANAEPVSASRGPTQHERVQHLCAECAEASQHDVEPMVGMGRVLARFPGDGMSPPGDCGWGSYIGLRVSVESAKAVVSMLGSCAIGDSCPFLALKIAAISAEIAARVALDATCFKGGDSGHRQQVQDKVNMLNRCYGFFTRSNCPQSLVSAMEVVVAATRKVMEGVVALAAAAVIVAAIAALVAAIIALVELIAAALAAAAAGAGAEAALAALAALLVVIQDSLSPADSPSGS